VERRCRTVGGMRTTTFAITASLLASPPLLVPPSHQTTGYSRAVTAICSGALLFEHPHAIGTDAGAQAAAQDIRRSARRRLDRVAAVPVPPELKAKVDRWIALQRRLAESFAVNWMLIHEAIDAAQTPADRARLPRVLRAFVHAPDALRRASYRLEVALNVPDCTGGERAQAPPLNAP
jgi:hypothetical protein